jgi:hypothetical protein
LTLEFRVCRFGFGSLGRSEIDKRPIQAASEKGESRKWLSSIALQGCSSIPRPYGIHLTKSRSDSTIPCLGSISSNSKNFTRLPKNTLAIAKTIMWRAAPLGRIQSSFPCRARPIPRTRRCRHLETGSFRVLLKRPENYDLRFRELIDQLFTQVADSLGGFGGNRIVRLEAGLLITSAATTTPFHFDPEIGFFSQIEGKKIYHLYPPSILGEEELERFYKLGRVAIAQIDLEGRDPAREHVFRLGPGKGLHQPQNAAHWVETRGVRSISYSFVFETEAGRARGRARAFNHFLRCLKLNPAPPGVNPAFDAIKSEAMRGVLPVRRRVADIVHRARAE